MNGEVYVPYTGIGGSNMNSGIMLLDLSGSSNPGVDSGQEGTDINVFWSYPGGITNQKMNGDGFWAYAVQSQTVDPNYDTDKTIKDWLMGNITGTSYNITTHFTEEQIENEDPNIIPAINELIYSYITRLLNNTGSSMDDFKNYFLNTGCYVTGRK